MTECNQKFSYRDIISSLYIFKIKKSIFPMA